MQPKIYSALFLCLIVATIVSAAPSTSTERKCVDGKSYHDGCHVCRCVGGISTCTEKTCMVYDEEYDNYVSLPTKKAPEDFWVPTQA